MKHTYEGDSYKSTGLLFLATIIILAVALTYSGDQLALAEDNTATGSSSETMVAVEQKSAESYDYVAAEGDNLTLLTRKAISEKIQADGLQLTTQQRAYAETLSVIDMGSSAIDVGESVSIPVAVIGKRIEQAQQLSQSQQAAWTTYSNDINFNDDLSAVGNGTASSDTSAADSSDQDANSDQDNTDNQSSNDQDDSTTNNQEATAEENDSNDSDSPASKAPLYAAGVLILGGWYYLWRKDTNSKKNK